MTLAIKGYVKVKVKEKRGVHGGLEVKGRGQRKQLVCGVCGGGGVWRGDNNAFFHNQVF